VAGTDSFEISFNHVHDGGPGTNGGEGIDAKAGSTNGRVFRNVVGPLNRLGIYVDAWDQHTFAIQVYQNIVHDCLSGFGVASEAGGLLENVTVYNNIAYHNAQLGIVVGWGTLPGPTTGIAIVNNTVYQNGSGGWGGGIDLTNPGAGSVVVRNNIAAGNLSFQIAIQAAPSNPVVDHNLIDAFKAYAGETYGSDSTTGDPLFNNPSAADFHLQRGSRAVDRGSSDGAPGNDFEGNPRPRGGGYDLGAFELQ
jgi:hypothetical protein